MAEERLLDRKKRPAFQETANTRCFALIRRCKWRATGPLSMKGGELLVQAHAAARDRPLARLSLLMGIPRRGCEPGRGRRPLTSSPFSDQDVRTAILQLLTHDLL
jgi:hypothetical protein